MANYISENFPATVNGDNVIAFTDAKTVKQDLVAHSVASLSQWYEEDPEKNHFGLIQLIGNYTRSANPLIMDLLSPTRDAIIEVNGVRGSFSYELPVETSEKVITVRDSSTMNGVRPGKDGAIIKLYLNTPFRNGDVLTADAVSSKSTNLFVSYDHRVRKEGNMYLHFMKLVSGQRVSYYDKQLLKAGVQYFKIGHALGEYDTHFSGVTGASSSGSIKCEFTLGQVRGVEGESTYFAGSKYLSEATARTQNFVEDAQRKISELGEVNNSPAEFVMFGSGVAGQSFRPRLVASTLEYFCLAELLKLEAYQLMFQRKGVIHENHGPVYLNEGIYHQARRGTRFTYTRPFGITKGLIASVFDYLFRNSDLEVSERYVEIECGKMFLRNVEQIFENDFYSLANKARVLAGDMSFLPSNPVSGDNLNMVMSPLRIKSTYLNGIGNLRLKHNPALDYVDLQDRSQKVDGQIPLTSYSGIIRDVTDTRITNAYRGIPMPTSRNGMTIRNANNNVFYIKPKGPNMFWGYENGRWDHRSTSGYVESVSKQVMAQGFWCHSSSAGWIMDNSKFVLIELVA